MSQKGYKRATGQAERLRSESAELEATRPGWTCDEAVRNWYPNIEFIYRKWQWYVLVVVISSGKLNDLIISHHHKKEH